MNLNGHDGVSCDSCMKGNFRDRRYKCLICYDYDLCATCYDAGASTSQHLSDHPMQCILTRPDFELYYGGESVSVEQPQSLTCPYCGKMGFTETTLQEHVSADHPDATTQVCCPLCAWLPGPDPNLTIDDLAGHLTLEHRSGPRDLISFLDESASSRSVRRIPHPTRGVGGQRPRRSNMHFSSSGGLSPSSREGIDPITELLSQLSSVRRSGGGSNSSAPSQLQQLQMQLQLERQHGRLGTILLQANRQPLDRLPGRQTQVIGSTTGTGGNSTGHSATMASVVANSSAANSNLVNTSNASGLSSSSSQNCTFLLPRCISNTLSESQLQNIERESANRSLFTRELVVSTLSQVLPELTQVTENADVAAPSATSASADKPSLNTSSVTCAKKVNPSQETKREQSSLKQHTAQQASHAVSATGSVGAGLQSQGAPQNPSGIAAQSAPINQSLMHSVIPQPLVLPQSLPPVRNTGTGTIREPVAAPAAYLRGGVGPVNVTGASRRKPVRAVDGRNQSTEPPPPH